MSEEIAALTPAPQDEEWWRERHQEKLKEVAQGDAQLIMIGDSITHSWETTGATTAEQYYGDRQLLNLGYSGDRTEHVLWRLQHGELEGLSPKLVVLLIGTNNTGHRLDKPEATAEGINAIVKEIQARVPKARLLLLGVLPRGAAPDDEMRQINDRINQLIARDAKQAGIDYLNLDAVFLGEEGRLAEALMPDELHPNAAGYQVWAEAMEPTLAKLLDEAPGN
ncbi:MAG: platelet-activating factor acetylhydrolase IB subunit [Planctomycetota bacterium]